MPTYEYACTRCGQHVEVFQRLSEPPLDTCGACGGPLRKVFHPAGIVFKGSGFYATDNRSKPKTEGGEGTKDGSKGAKKETGGSPSSGSDSSSASPAKGEPASGGGSGTGSKRGSGSGAGSGAASSAGGEKTS